MLTDYSALLVHLSNTFQCFFVTCVFVHLHFPILDIDFFYLLGILDFISLNICVATEIRSFYKFENTPYKIKDSIRKVKSSVQMLGLPMLQKSTENQQSQYE